MMYGIVYPLRENTEFVLMGTFPAGVLAFADASVILLKVAEAPLNVPFPVLTIVLGPTTVDTVSPFAFPCIISCGRFPLNETPVPSRGIAVAGRFAGVIAGKTQLATISDGVITPAFTAVPLM